MRQTEWTKGPWIARTDSVNFAIGVYGGRVAGEDRQWIADTNCGSFDAAERIANTNLIAKAPEMAELLRAYANGDYHDAAAGLMAAFDEAVERLLNELGPR